MRSARAIGFAVFALTLSVGCGSDGGDGNGDGDGDGDGDVTSTAYRITTLNLMDPHTFFSGLDVTTTVDGLIGDSLVEDTAEDPPDGNLDLSILTVFRPLDQASGTTPMQVVFGNCTAPADSTTCSPDPAESPVASTGTNGNGPCLEPLADTTSDFSPAIVNPAGPCFASGAETFNVALGEIVLGMQEAIISGTYVGDPATSVTTGLIRGFVTQETADAAMIPDDVMFVGGMPVSALLRDQDKDVGPGGADGWWFYLNFEAELVPYTP